MTDAHPRPATTIRIGRTPDNDIVLTRGLDVSRHHAELHRNPDGSYEMANLVLAFEPPRVISRQPGYVSPATGKLEFGGWVWRYDLTQLGPDETEVTLSYDWSAVGPIPRQRIQFPPFTPGHLDNSLSHLAAIVAR